MSKELKEEFDFAVSQIRLSKGSKSGNGPTNEEKLLFYKYYKQATEGDCKGTQPWAVNYEARAKWDAWDSVRGLSKEDAMRKYCELYLDISQKYN